jgi:hypothetical protein
MPKPKLQPPLDQLESDICETLLAGLHEWRPDLCYPESRSDMQGCVRALLRMYDVKRRPVAVALPIWCETCQGRRKVLTLVDGDLSTRREIACPSCVPVQR